MMLTVASVSYIPMYDTVLGGNICYEAICDNLLGKAWFTNSEPYFSADVQEFIKREKPADPGDSEV